jgi:hypothetical protein
VVFFDDEEPTTFWTEPLGSRIYVEEFGIQNLHAVLDFEMCGMGDAVGIWPVEGIENQAILKQITSMFSNLQIPWDVGKRIPGFYADYLPFRNAGLMDSYCFTCFHWQERERVRRFSEGKYQSFMLRYAAWKMLRLPTLPKIFRHYHTATDRSEFLSTKTLAWMSDLVYRMVLKLNFPNR